jgi:hypothetical protein
MQRKGRFPLHRPVAREEPAREDAVGRDADPQLAAGGKNLLLDPAREERVLDLQVGDRVHRVRAPDRLGPDLGETDVADIARLDQLADRTHRLLARDVGEDAPGPVDIHVVDAKPSERVSEEVLDRCRPHVVSDDRSVGGAHEPELDADHRLVAVTSFERVANEELVVPGGVVVARVEQGDAGVERSLDRRDRLRLIGGAVEVGHAHTAEAEGGDGEASGAERTRVHADPPMFEGEYQHRCDRFHCSSDAASQGSFRPSRVGGCRRRGSSRSKEPI